MTRDRIAQVGKGEKTEKGDHSSDSGPYENMSRTEYIQQKEKGIMCMVLF